MITTSEAIESLNGCVVAYEVDPKTGGSNGNLTCDITQEVLDAAISALKKQEPMSTMPPELSVDGRVITACGNCGEEIRSMLYSFCPWCGQKILSKR